MDSRRWHRQFICFVLAAAGAAFALGISYAERLGDHDGHDLVDVRDRIPNVEALRPRKAVLVVVDGLGLLESRTLPAWKWMAREGQCHPTRVGPITISRPMYAMISTGLEEGRTGCRNNANTDPLRAESIWEAARLSGKTVVGISEVDWWMQLFPNGFSRYDVRPAADNFFDGLPFSDVTLVHPVYVDDAGHAAGAASALYQQAMHRADHELTQLISAMDLRQDVLVVTADHGQSLRGGHGGAEPRVSWTQTCFVGAGVRNGGWGSTIHATAVVPTFAVLAGLRFPRHMRAVEDDLDVIKQVVNPLAFPPGYLSDRLAAVERFRDVNRQWLRERLPADMPPVWSARYAQLQVPQDWRLVAVLGIALLIMLLAAVRRVRVARWSDAIFGLAWAGTVCIAAYAAEVLVRGTFDLTAVNERDEFIVATGALCLVVIGFGLFTHVVLRGNPSAMMEDLALLIASVLVLNAGHPWVYGWTLGMVLPGPEMLFFPFFGAIFLSCLCGLGFCLAVLGLWMHGRQHA